VVERSDFPTDKIHLFRMPTNAIASRSRIERAIPIGIDPRDSSAADGHGWSAGASRADVVGQESQLAALLEIERLAMQKKRARE
jgi:hypothetical protein